ncbi:UNVERIFIED_ORG: hypothetical protein FHR35_009223 [Microbispora rosea subsp. rosea]
MEAAHRFDRAVQPPVAVSERRVVEEVHVEPVGAEVVQGLLQLPAHVPGLEAVLSGAGEVSDLRHKHDVLAGHPRDEVTQ